jgi:putative transcriptional regulator
MAIDVKLDLVLVKRRISLTELSARIGISITNLSLLKTGKVKGIRFSTLDSLCRELDCRPGDILEYSPGPADRGRDREAAAAGGEGPDE